MLDILLEARRSLARDRLVSGLRKPSILLWFVAGLGGLWLGPQDGLNAIGLVWLAARALGEELTFRVLVQASLDPLLPRWGLPLITPGNVLVSAVFALLHLFTQSPVTALSTFFPSLVFGYVWTTTRSLWLCAGMHAWYNLLYCY